MRISQQAEDWISKEAAADEVEYHDSLVFLLVLAGPDYRIRIGASVRHQFWGLGTIYKINKTEMVSVVFE